MNVAFIRRALPGLDDLGWACYSLGWEPEQVVDMLYAIDHATNRSPAEVMRGTVALYPQPEKESA